MSKRSIIIFGAGPGIGNNVASAFASHHFNHVVLLARNENHLKEDKEYVAKAGSNINVDTRRLDLSDLESIPIEVVYFNAAVVAESEPLVNSYKEIETDFRTTNLALYIIAQWAVPLLQKLSKSTQNIKPSLFVTSSHLPWDPAPQHISLSMTKASQANLIQSLHRAFGKSGIHFGLIHIEGAVGPDEANLNPRNIGRKVYKFFNDSQELGLHIKQ